LTGREERRRERKGKKNCGPLIRDTARIVPKFALRRKKGDGQGRACANPRKYGQCP
jgi:hypothetical protein